MASSCIEICLTLNRQRESNKPSARSQAPATTRDVFLETREILLRSDKLFSAKQNSRWYRKRIDSLLRLCDTSRALGADASLLVAGMRISKSVTVAMIYSACVAVE